VRRPTAVEAPRGPSSQTRSVLTSPTRLQEVASILLTRGSLAFPQLTRLSALPPTTIYSCLLILSLHSLLFHSESEVNGRLVELYEMNEVGIERRMRGGWYVEMAREWNEAACLDAVIESLWMEGMQKADSMAEVAARAMMKRQKDNDAEREGFENRGEDVPERLKFKGKKVRLHSFEDGEFRSRLLTLSSSLADLAFPPVQPARPPRRCFAKRSRKATSPSSPRARSCPPARSRSSGRRSFASASRVSSDCTSWSKGQH